MYRNNVLTKLAKMAATSWSFFFLFLINRRVNVFFVKEQNQKQQATFM